MTDWVAHGRAAGRDTEASGAGLRENRFTRLVISVAPNEAAPTLRRHTEKLLSPTQDTVASRGFKSFSSLTSPECDARYQLRSVEHARISV
jgi:hypothetical protein